MAMDTATRPAADAPKASSEVATTVLDEAAAQPLPTDTGKPDSAVTSDNGAAEESNSKEGEESAAPGGSVDGDAGHANGISCPDADAPPSSAPPEAADPATSEEAQPVEVKTENPPDMEPPATAEPASRDAAADVDTGKVEATGNDSSASMEQPSEGDGHPTPQADSVKAEPNAESEKGVEAVAPVTSARSSASSASSGDKRRADDPVDEPSASQPVVKRAKSEEEPQEQEETGSTGAADQPSEPADVKYDDSGRQLSPDGKPMVKPLPDFVSDSAERAPNERRTTNQLQFMEKHVLKHLSAHQWYWPFSKPVDVKRFTTYTQIIQKPMDFATIRANLRKKEYWTARECALDCQQVFTNCYTFNQPAEVCFPLPYPALLPNPNRGHCRGLSAVDCCCTCMS